MTQPLYRERLSKKFFVSLPAGLYLVSNVALAPGQPIFAKLVVPLETREAQWKRIKEVRVDGQLCSVFQTAADYIKYSLEVRYPNHPNPNQHN